MCYLCNLNSTYGKTAPNPFQVSDYLSAIKKITDQTTSTSTPPTPDEDDDTFLVEKVGTNKDGDDVVRDMNGTLYILVEL